MAEKDISADGLRAQILEDMGISESLAPESEEAKYGVSEEEAKLESKPESVDQSEGSTSEESQDEEGSQDIETEVDEAAAEYERLQGLAARYERWGPVLDYIERRIAYDKDWSDVFMQLLDERTDISQFRKSAGAPAQQESSYLFDDETSVGAEPQYLTTEQAKQLFDQMAAQVIQQAQVRAQLPLFQEAINRWCTELADTYGIKVTDQEKQQMVTIAVNAGALRDDWYNQDGNPLEQAYLALKAKEVIKRQKAQQEQAKINQGSAPAGRTNTDRGERDHQGSEDLKTLAQKLRKQLEAEIIGA